MAAWTKGGQGSVTGLVVPGGLGETVIVEFGPVHGATAAAEPDADGMYDLSEIGEVSELKINRMTPYSIAEPST